MVVNAYNVLINLYGGASLVFKISAIKIIIGGKISR
jgi:hypothetical protein